MKAFLSSLWLPAVVLVAGLPAAARAGVEHGAELVSENCQKCHHSDVYTRPDHFVKSLDGLNKQVRRCAQSQSLTWFDDEIGSVVDYLNQNYYHFPKPE